MPTLGNISPNSAAVNPLQVIDPVCARHTAVLTSSKVLLKLSNGPEEPEVMIVPRHKKFEGAGKKATTKTKVRPLV